MLEFPWFLLLSECSIQSQEAFLGMLEQQVDSLWSIWSLWWRILRWRKSKLKTHCWQLQFKRTKLRWWYPQEIETLFRGTSLKLPNLQAIAGCKGKEAVRWWVSAQRSSSMIDSWRERWIKTKRSTLFTKNSQEAQARHTKMVNTLPLPKMASPTQNPIKG